MNDASNHPEAIAITNPAPAPIDNKERFFEDHSEDVQALRAERDPDADLARTVARRS